MAVEPLMLSCFHPLTGQKLPTFVLEKEAIEKVLTSWKHSRNAMYRFRCVQCRRWHLIPESDVDHVADAPRVNCPHCTSKRGNRKALYASSSAAQSAMNGLTIDTGRGAGVYPCPFGLGWHVTTSI